jgi:hypothetical protein
MAGGNKSNSPKAIKRKTQRQETERHQRAAQKAARRQPYNTKGR